MLDWDAKAKKSRTLTGAYKHEFSFALKHRDTHNAWKLTFRVAPATKGSRRSFMNVAKCSPKKADIVKKIHGPTHLGGWEAQTLDLDHNFGS